MHDLYAPVIGMKPATRMRVLHVSERHRLTDGGLTTAVNALAGATRQIGHEVAIFTVDGEASIPDGVARFGPLSVGFGRSWLWSPGLRQQLRQAFADFRPDIVHTHGCWMAPQLFGLKLAGYRRLRTIASFHNFLDPWLSDEQGWQKKAKKKTYWRYIGCSVFASANIHHAITDREAIDIRNCFPHSRIAVIPNFVDDVSLQLSREKMTAGAPAKHVVFLGRVSRVKGLDFLIEAFARAGLINEWKLIIAGPIEDSVYWSDLTRSIRRLDMTDSVTAVGLVSRADKWSLLSRAWIVCVPSHTEVIGMVNLEAGLCGTPTITTPATGLSEWDKYGGVLTKPDVKALSASLQAVTAWTESERIARGMMLRQYVLRTFSQQAVMLRWMDTYRELIDEQQNIGDHSNQERIPQFASMPR